MARRSIVLVGQSDFNSAGRSKDRRNDLACNAFVVGAHSHHSNEVHFESKVFQGGANSHISCGQRAAAQSKSVLAKEASPARFKLVVDAKEGSDLRRRAYDGVAPSREARRKPGSDPGGRLRQSGRGADSIRAAADNGPKPVRGSSSSVASGRIVAVNDSKMSRHALVRRSTIARKHF